MGRVVATRATIEPFLVMEVVAAALAHDARGGDVLHLEVGQPGSGAPRAAVDAAIESLRSGDPLGYTPACGTDVLRRRIARLYLDRHGIEVDASQVVVTAGASGAAVLALLAAFDVGARVAVAEPGYPCYRRMITAFGMEPVAMRVGPDNGFLVTAEAVEDLAATRRAAGLAPIDGLIVASPANPTGSMYGPEALADLAASCDRHDLRLIADEIYHGITFDRPAPTMLAHDIGAIVLGSFSKYFSMTGWRLGWMIVPEELAQPVDRLSQNLYLSPPALSQRVALAALDCGGELDSHVARYRTNRARLAEALQSIGVDEFAPSDGAFYLYGAVGHWGLPSDELCRIWLDELAVAATPGIDFDPVDGHRWVRWSLAGSTADIDEAGRRLTQWASGRPLRGHG